jgi:hypothetical protein
MIRQATEKKEILDGLAENYSILYVGDASDAVFRSLNDFAEGIYNITPDETSDGNQIATGIHHHFIVEPPVPQPVAPNRVTASNTRAKAELGFINRISLEKGIQHCYDWVRQNPKAALAKTGKASKDSDRTVLLRYLETVAFFFLFALITYWQAGWSMATSLNFMVIYLIITSAVFGTYCGVLAAFLVSCFNIYSSVANGMRSSPASTTLTPCFRLFRTF